MSVTGMTYWILALTFQLDTEYFLTENVKLYLDAVYQYGKKEGIKMINNPVLSLGIAYAF